MLRRPKLGRSLAIGVGQLLVTVALCGSDRPPQSVVYTVTEIAMGTTVDLTLIAPDTATAQAWVRSVAPELHRIGFDFWEGEPRGALGRLNRSRRTDDRELIQLIDRAFEISRLTGGAFDIRVGELIRRYGFLDQAGEITRPDSVAALAAAAQALRWEPANDGGYRLTGSHATLTLGGIAKGYAVDVVVDRLQQLGCRAGLVNAGGDLRAWGGTADKPWRIGIEDPGNGYFLAVLELASGAVATSGSYRNRTISQGDTIHHIIDPGSGRSVRGKQSVTVTAPTCTLADALATGFFVMPPDRALALADSLPGVGLLLLSSDGVVVEDEDLAGLRSGVHPPRP